jgi:hypothetical protein
MGEGQQVVLPLPRVTVADCGVGGRRAKVAEGGALRIPLGKGKDRSALEYVGTISIFFLSLLFSFPSM